MDLVVGASGARAAALLLGDGTGRYLARPVAAPTLDAYGETYQVGLADFDGDGRDEVVLAGLGYIWVHAGGSQAVGPAVEVPTLAWYFEAVDVAGPYDVDGDGLDDLVFAGLVSTVTAFGSGSGVPVLDVYDTWIQGDPPELGPIPFLEIDVGDVDGDGQTDFLSESYWSFGARLTYGGTDLAGARLWSGSLGSMLGPALVGDVDGDGIDDVRGGDEVFLGSPAGLTNSTVPYQPPATVEGLPLDVDGNGVLGTVVWEDGLAWYRDRPAAQAPDQFLPARAGITRAELVVGDVDGDGYDDVYALATDHPDSFLLWFAGSAGGLGSPVSVADGVPGDGLVSCDDSNGDGRCELLVRRWPSPYVAFPGTATGPGNAVSVPALAAVRYRRDYDGDGLVDLLGQTASGAAAVVYSGPTGWDGSSFTVLSEPRLDARPLGDVDGDGFEDVAVVGLGTLNAGEVRVHYGSGSGLDPVPASVLVGSDAEGLGQGVVAVDVDGDGVKELVVGAFAHGDGAGALHVYEP